jgi:uncharacterized protein (DUF1330 family)
MKSLLKPLVIAVFVCACTLAALGASDSRVYEMRIYYAAPGKLDELHARFRDHTVKLFEKHGIVNVGYWVPVENTDNKLIYVLSYPDRDAREKSWKAFMADSDWQKAWKESEANGKLVTKFESFFMTPTDYSPAIKSPEDKSPRVFELRTYTATPGKLDNLNARFRDHTLKLFEKHGMTNLGYWNLMKDQKGADDTLIYILAHKSKEAAKESFAGFGKDPDWQAARKASEEKAGGSLTVKDGVKSVFMAPTDYSPIK